MTKIHIWDSLERSEWVGFLSGFFRLKAKSRDEVLQLLGDLNKSLKDKGPTHNPAMIVKQLKGDMK